MNIERLKFLTTKYYNNTSSIDEKIEFVSIMRETSQDKYKWHYILQDLLKEKELLTQEETRKNMEKEIEDLSIKWLKQLEVSDKKKIQDLRKLDDIYYPLKNLIIKYKKDNNDFPKCKYLTFEKCCGSGLSPYNNICKHCHGKGFKIIGGKLI